MERTESRISGGCLCHEHFLLSTGIFFKEEKITSDYLLQKISKGVFLGNYGNPMLKFSESKSSTLYMLRMLPKGYQESSCTLKTLFATETESIKLKSQSATVWISPSNFPRPHQPPITKYIIKHSRKLSCTVTINENYNSNINSNNNMMCSTKTKP